jgi:hypothetical protein
MADTIDVTGVPELKLLAEDVHDSKRSRILTADGERLAILMPVDDDDGPVVYDDLPDRVITDEDRAATLSSFGGWAGLIDAEELKAEVREGRGSSRGDSPPL